MSLSIGAEAFESPDAQRLIAALDAGLAELYPPEQRFGPNLKAQHLEDGRGTFLVARDDSRAVACGAVRMLDATTGEIKRMYVVCWRRAVTRQTHLPSIAGPASRRSNVGASTPPRPPASAWKNGSDQTAASL